MTSLVPPSSGKKKAKARRVFGDAIIDAADTNSLSYSPSPRKTKQPLARLSENSEASTASSVSKGSTRMSTKPFETVLAATPDKENYNNRSTISVIATKPQVERSPLRRDLIQKTQDAINKASISVNQSLVAAKKAKESSYRYKAFEASKIREEWKEETTEARLFYKDAAQSYRDHLSLRRELSTKLSKEKARRQQYHRQDSLKKMDEEAEFKSSVYREHQKQLKEEEDRRRRMSIAVRAKLRENHRIGEDTLRMQRVEEDQAVIEERHEASLALRNTTQANAQDRRKSFCFRGHHARRIRQLYDELESRRLEDEHNSFELKWAGEKDAEAYARQLKNERRQSLNGRGQHARQQKKQEDDAASKRSVTEHESFEFKFAGDRDADTYKRQVEEERRKSLAMRNAEARRQRQVESEQHELAANAEHASYELKWGGDKDAQDYQRSLQRARRESLAGRNKESANHARVMTELELIANEKQRESLVLKWAGENDAKAYLERLREDRRLSLQGRGKQSRHHRSVEEEQKLEELNRQQKDEELRSAAQKDVEAYQKKCAERDRTSLEYRRKEARMHRVEETKNRVEQQVQDDKDFELETQARTDVDEYITDCKQRRRMSLALRAKEKRRNKKWSQTRHDEAIDDRRRRVNDRLLDRRHTELARQQERARLAMDAIQHAGCSFNPFFGVL